MSHRVWGPAVRSSNVISGRVPFRCCGLLTVILTQKASDAWQVRPHSRIRPDTAGAMYSMPAAAYHWIKDIRRVHVRLLLP